LRRRSYGGSAQRDAVPASGKVLRKAVSMNIFQENAFDLSCAARCKKTAPRPAVQSATALTAGQPVVQATVPSAAEVACEKQAMPWPSVVMTSVNSLLPTSWITLSLPTFQHMLIDLESILDRFSGMYFHYDDCIGLTCVHSQKQKFGLTHTNTNTNTQTHKHTNTQAHKHTNTQTHKHTHARTHARACARRVHLLKLFSLYSH